MLAGFDGYAPKPFDASGLLSQLKEVLSED